MSNNITINPEQADRLLIWAEALESGDYQQGEGVLRSRDDKYCCWGVFWDLFGYGWGGCGAYGYRGVDPEADTDYLYLLGNDFVKGMTGLGMKVGEPLNGLAGRNDQGDTFMEIASRIRMIRMEHL